MPRQSFEAADQLRQHRRRREHAIDLARGKQLAHAIGLHTIHQEDRRSGVEEGAGQQRCPVRIRRHQQDARLRRRLKRQAGAQHKIGKPAPAVAVHDRLRIAGSTGGEQELAPRIAGDDRGPVDLGRCCGESFDPQRCDARRLDARRGAFINKDVADVEQIQAVADLIDCEPCRKRCFRRARQHHAGTRPDRRRRVRQ